jgi:hypothetical protein
MPPDFMHTAGNHLPQTSQVSTTLLVSTIADTAMQKQLIPPIWSGAPTDTMRLPQRVQYLHSTEAHLLLALVIQWEAHRS